MSAPLDPAVLARLLARFDFNRAPLGPSIRGPRYKEWLYFGVGAPELDVVACFATVDGPPPRPVPRVARLLVFLRDGAGWRGTVERGGAGDRLPGGEIGARVGRSAVRCEGATYHLELAPQDFPLRASLRLEARSAPAPLHQRPTLSSPPMSWVVVPRVAASGWVEVDGARRALQGAPAYHDHNWGTFDFGHDFTWEWGYGLFAGPWSAVVVRFADAARSRALEQALFLWKEGRQVRVFTGSELEVRRRGRLRPRAVPKVPGTLRLLAPGRATDVPASYEVRARRGGDRVRLRFEAGSALQLLVPADAGRAVTRVHEVAGGLRLSGRVAGEAVEASGRGVFEFLAAGAAPPLPPASCPGVGKGASTASSAAVRLFDDALAELEQRGPAHLAAAAHALGPHRVDARVGTARFSVVAAGDGLSRGPAADGAELRLALSEETLLSLLEGRRGLLETARSGDLRLRGRPGALRAFDGALRAFLHGCVRTPRGEERLSRYRDEVRSLATPGAGGRGT